MTLDRNSTLALKLGATAVAMFGFGYALVPLYDVFCEITGLNGKTGVATAAQIAAGVDEERLVTVEFDSNVNPALPWKFGPLQKKVQVHPGQIMEVQYFAENTSDRPVVGQAVPSVAPTPASLYFNKTECFCFTQQTLAPGERRVMPVRFIVAPDMPDKYTTLTLSYTFFAAPDQTAARDADTRQPS
ncbi:MAG TPA: cytochrome c oxidase assembly protein [Gammaproteobacteria bacterium]|jgi:cytochrome c oxidase assembly protein subunit 11